MKISVPFIALTFFLIANGQGKAKEFMACLDSADIKKCEKLCKEDELTNPSITNNDPSCTPFREGTHGCYCEQLGG
jgi:hypothetical protein